MTIPDLDELSYEGGVYSDPTKLTDLARRLQNANSRAVASSIVAKTSAGLLFGFTVSSVAAQFIQVFDATSVPADGVVPTISFPVAATNAVTVVWVPPRGFRSGIVLCNSSTQHTKNIGGTDCIFDVQFL